MSDAASTSGPAHSCPLCPKTYKRREHLHRHAASHSSIRPYRCTLCSQSYQRADVLRRHSQTCQAKAKIGGTASSTGRRACDLCVRQKKACSTGQPCENCRRRSVQCFYSFDSGPTEGSIGNETETQDTEIESLTNGQSLIVPTSDINHPIVEFGDDSLFDYLGNYTSVYDLIDGPNTNQGWLDFANLAAGSFQATPTSPQTQLNNYRFHFLDNFTRRTGLVESFDCGTFDQRVQVVSQCLKTEGDIQSALTTSFEDLGNPLATTQLDPASANSSLLPMSIIHDPLIIQTHQILLNVKEVVTVKPRNSVVALEWSTILEQSCMQFFSPRNLRKFLVLFWHIWHPNVNFIHRPTFDPANSKSILVAAMALIGASVSPIKSENEQAKMWFNCVEEMVFTDDDFCNDPLNSQDTTVLDPLANISKIQALQAAYIVCLYQGWEGTDASKRRIRRYRYSTVISMARDFGIMSARHTDPSTALQYGFNWKDFAAREQLIRIFLWIYLLDHAFVIFNNLPPRMVIKEMSMHMAFPEAAFQATTASECAQEIHDWHFRSMPIHNITFREVVEIFCKSSVPYGMRRCFANLGPLNLFAIVSAFHALIFQHQNSFGGDDQLQAVRNALGNWKSAWETYSDEFSSSPPHVMVDDSNLSPDDMWRRIGFIRHSPEYWLLARLLVDRLSSSTNAPPNYDPTLLDGNGATHEPILSRYDQTSMLQVNDLIAGFQNVHIR